MISVYFLYIHSFEFDPVKSAANHAKHGIDFDAARSIWSDPHRIEVPARTTDEQRCDRIRIISVRRSREGEEELYEG